MQHSDIEFHLRFRHNSLVPGLQHILRYY